MIYNCKDHLSLVKTVYLARKKKHLSIEIFSRFIFLESMYKDFVYILTFFFLYTLYRFCIQIASSVAKNAPTKQVHEP